MKKLYHSVLNNILDEVTVQVKTKGELRFVELLNLKLYYLNEKSFLTEAFPTLDKYKEYWIWMDWNASWNQKSLR